MSINEKVTSNKIRDIEIKTKLNDLERKLISTKGLTVGLIDKYSILNGAKYFSVDGLHNYLVFLTFRKYVFIFETNKNNDISSWKSTGLSEGKNYKSI